MLLAAALSLSLFSHWPYLHGRRDGAPRSHASARVGPWRIAVKKDRFSGDVTCSIGARGVSFRRDTLIFRLARAGDATNAVFRVDGGPARPISETFDTVEAHGFFPQRGWILDPQGGEAALPAAVVSRARAVTIRLAPKSHPRQFAIARLAEARAAAAAAGCPTRKG